MVIEWSQFDNDFRGVIALKMGVSYRLVRTKWQNSTNFVRFEREYLAETSQLGAFSVKTSQGTRIPHNGSKQGIGTPRG